MLSTGQKLPILCQRSRRRMKSQRSVILKEAPLITLWRRWWKTMSLEWKSRISRKKHMIWLRRYLKEMKGGRTKYRRLMLKAAGCRAGRGFLIFGRRLTSLLSSVTRTWRTGIQRFQGRVLLSRRKVWLAKRSSSTSPSSMAPAEPSLSPVRLRKANTFYPFRSNCPTTSQAPFMIVCMMAKLNNSRQCK